MKNKINKLLHLLGVLLVFEGASGQRGGMPPEVENWLYSILQNAGGKNPLTGYNDDDLFFSTDSATLIGYLKGYRPSEGFKTGMIHIENEFSRANHPVVVKIGDDGRFEARMPMWHPKVVSLDFNNQWLEFYIEPGQTLGLVIDWHIYRKNEKNEALQFYGPLAGINRSRNSIPLSKTDEDGLAKQVKKVGPQQFKKVTLRHWDLQKKLLDSILVVHQSDEKSKALAYAELNLHMMMRLHNYIRERDDQRRSGSSNIILEAKLPADFFDFIHRVSFADNSIFISKQFSSFLNQMEFDHLYKETIPWMNEFRGAALEKVVGADKMRDSIARKRLYLHYGKIYDVIRLHRVASAFKFDLRSASSDTLTNYLEAIKAGLYNKFYQKQADLLLKEALRKRDKTGTAIPDSYAGNLFKKMIAPYAGKVIFIDFWATTCGPCIGDIQQLYAIREKYKDNKDFTFLFVTSEDESPKRAYQSFVKKQKLVHTVYLSNDDYRYLRELFGIYGIPRYATISKDGRVLDDDFEMHNFRSEIGNYFPQYHSVIQ